MREEQEIIGQKLVHDVDEVIGGGLGCDNERVFVGDVGFSSDRDERSIGVCGACSAECGGEV